MKFLIFIEERFDFNSGIKIRNSISYLDDFSFIRNLGSGPGN